MTGGKRMVSLVTAVLLGPMVPQVHHSRLTFRKWPCREVTLYIGLSLLFQWTYRGVRFATSDFLIILTIAALVRCALWKVWVRECSSVVLFVIMTAVRARSSMPDQALIFVARSIVVSISAPCRMRKASSCISWNYRDSFFWYGEQSVRVGQVRVLD